jgi:hypothetical protein
MPDAVILFYILYLYRNEFVLMMSAVAGQLATGSRACAPELLSPPTVSDRQKADFVRSNEEHIGRWV